MILKGHEEGRELFSHPLARVVMQQLCAVPQDGNLFVFSILWVKEMPQNGMFDQSCCINRREIA